MIKIKKIAIGNQGEAFIEDRFNEGINIIFSDDNNKGKTIIAQGIYYILGNEPIFPTGFNYKDCFFIIELNVNNKTVFVCRKNDTFLVNDNGFNLFNNVSEFKRYFDKNIYKMPVILKDDKEKLTDLELFFQLFFVGQDKRNTSQVFNNGYNTKEDFINMIYALSGCIEVISDFDKDEIKAKISDFKTEREILKKQHKILSKNVSAISIASYTNNKEAIIKKILMVEKKKNEIVLLKNERNRLFNKKIKNEILLKELRSLNRNLSEGQLMCLECGSNHVGYENPDKEICFDVSDSEIRNNILENVKNRIEASEEEIIKLDRKLSEKQIELNSLMNDNDVSLEHLLLYKSDLQGASEPDKKIMQIDKEIEKLKNILNTVKLKENNISISKEEITKQILEEMQSLYKKMDPTGRLDFSALFTQRDQTYSGSEGSEYYLAKIYSFAKILKHPFPIIMDAFREGELSTPKEAIVINNFKDLPNQIIFTATLKEQEKGKYDAKEFEGINKIDYSVHETSHILNKKYVPEFIQLTKLFSLNLG